MAGERKIRDFSQGAADLNGVHQIDFTVWLNDSRNFHGSGEETRPGKFREIWFASGWTVAFFDPSFCFFNSFNHITPWQN